MAENPKFRKILNQAYKDSPVAYSTLKKLYEYTKKEIPRINKGIVGDYLLSQPMFSQYRQKPVKSKMITRPLIKKEAFNNLSADLLTLISLKNKNRHFQYILVIYDLTSHFMQGIALKSKKLAEIKRGFDTAFQDPIVQKNKLHLLWIDRGAELLGMKDYLKEKYHLKIYVTNSGLRKSWPAERAIKELSKRIFRKLAATDSTSWISILPKILEQYNNDKQTSLLNYSPM